MSAARPSRYVQAVGADDRQQPQRLLGRRTGRRGVDHHAPDAVRDLADVDDVRAAVDRAVYL